MTTKPKQKKIAETEKASAFTAKAFLERLTAHQSDEELQKFTRYFKFEVGKQSKDPRVLLRYAIEHLDEKQRAHYLGMKSAG